MAPSIAKLAGVSMDVQKIVEAKMDEAPARCGAQEAFKDVQLSINHCLFKVMFNFSSLFIIFLWISCLS